MWTIFESTIDENITGYKILENGVLIDYKKWIENLNTSTDFIEFFFGVLKSSKYEGFFWEVKPVTRSSINEVFEFVIVESKTLPHIEADSSSFTSYFEQDKSVVTFPNLRGDAQLVVPTPLTENANYGHLAAFVRKAPKSQIIKFWQQVGKEYERLIGEEPKWLSTAGLGVYWLHVRIDSAPKYYNYHKYKKLT